MIAVCYSIDSDGHLDLSQCFHGLTCDMMLASKISRSYYESQLLNLVAWDSTPVTNMRYDSTWMHLVSKHGKSREQFNPILNLDLNRVVRLPVLKATVEGRLMADVYLQRQRGREDRLQVLVSGIDKDYVVVLGSVANGYVLRSAYLGDEKYTEKIRARGELIERIEP